VAPPPGRSSAPQADVVAALKLLDELRPALQRQDRARQVEIIGRLVALRAPMGQQWQALAQLAAGHGEITLARNAIDLFVEATGGFRLALYQMAALLDLWGALEVAFAVLCNLPVDVPDRAANAFSRGTAALFLGDVGEARRQLETAVQLRPNAGAAWLSLAMSVDLAAEPAVADRILSAERHMAGAEAAQRAAYYFALGKARAELGEPALAFDAFSRGAKAMKSLASYDRDADRHDAEESLSGYSPDAISAVASRQREPTARSIFVTGSPRSGTTLVEQILTSHSGVDDGAEINRLVLLAREIGGHSYGAVRSYVNAHGAEKAALLWRHWMTERFPAPGRVVDKTLNTTRFIGLAASLLPEAPLIWLTRDPLDCAWSCFRTFFVTSLPWTYDLEDIAFHFRLEEELLRRWQETLGERLLVVPYQALVQDSEGWIRRILSHCGLSAEPQVFAPHATARTVTTSSVMQVRRPINRTAIGSAGPYRQFLEPFLNAYYG
jgi:tetratricopeptide (TPR) repeat protein